MGALLILFLVIAYLVISIWVIAKVKPRWGKWVTLMLAILIPTADAVYGRLRLRVLCEEGGGLKIFHTVKGVTGFLDQNDTPHDFWIKTFGYRYVEGLGKGEQFARIDFLENGEIHRQENVVPKSRYAYRYDFGTVEKFYSFGRDVIFERKSGQILGTYTGFQFEGGWLERAVAGLYNRKGSAGGCKIDNPGDAKTKLVLSTLLTTY